MSETAELEKLAVSLVGDHSDYSATIDKAVSDTLAGCQRVEAGVDRMMAAQNQAMQEAARITAAVATPTERYANTISGMQGLLNAGYLSQENYNRALAAARQALPEVQAAEHARVAGLQATQRTQQEGARLTASLQTAEERYAVTVRDLQGFLQAGAISQETYNRALTQARQILPQVQALERTRTIALEAQERAQQEGERLTNSLRSAEERYAQTQQQVNNLLRAGTISQTTYNRAIEQAQQELPQVRAEQERVNNSLQAAQRLYTAAQRPAETYRLRLLEINTAYREGYVSAETYTRSVRNLTREFSTAGQTIQQFGSHMTSIGRSLSLYVTAPLTLMGGMAVREFGKFDQAMTESMAIMGRESKPFRKEMEEVARSLSFKTATDPTELAKGYYYLASAGYTAEQSMKALSTVNDFAIAGAFQMSKATEMLADSQSALGLKTADVTQNMKNMARVSDVLVLAANKSNATVEQFAQSLTNKAAGALRLVNKEVEEGVAVLAAYADQGVKGETAGEYLSIVLRDLKRASMESSGEWKKLGLSVFDAQGNMRNMADIIQGLETTLAGMSDQEKYATLSMLGFQDRSLAMLQVLFGTSQKIRDYEADLKKAGGTTKEVADDQMEAFNNQMKMLGNQVKAVGAEIAVAMLPAITALTNALKDGIEWWKSLNDAQKSFLVYVGMTAAAIGPLVVITGILISSVGRLVIGYQVLNYTLGLNISLAGAAKVAYGALAVGGVALVATAVYQLRMDTIGLNSVFQESLELADKLSKRDRAKVTDVLDHANSLQSPDAKKNYLTEQLKQAEVELKGVTENIGYAQKEYDRLNTTFKSFVGNKELELAKKNLEEAKLRARGFADGVDEIKRALKGVDQAGKDIQPPAILPDTEGHEGVPHEGRKTARRSEAMMKKYENPQEGFNRAQQELNDLLDAGKITIDDYNRKIDEAKAKMEKKGLAGAVKDLNIDLQKQFDMFGKSASEARVYELQLKGASAEQLKEANALASKITYLEKEKKEREKATELLKKYMTPQQEFANAQKDLQLLMDKGLITMEVFNAELAEAKAKMDKALKVKFTVEGIDAVEAGSSEALAHIQRYQREAQLAIKGGSEAKPLDLGAAKIVQAGPLGDARKEARKRFMERRATAKSNTVARRVGKSKAVATKRKKGKPETAEDKEDKKLTLKALQDIALNTDPKNVQPPLILEEAGL